MIKLLIQRKRIELTQNKMYAIILNTLIQASKTHNHAFRNLMSVKHNLHLTIRNLSQVEYNLLTLMLIQRISRMEVMNLLF